MLLSASGGGKARHLRSVEMSHAPLSLVSVVAALQSELRDRRGDSARTLGRNSRGARGPGSSGVVGTVRAACHPQLQCKRNREALQAHMTSRFTHPRDCADYKDAAAN